METSATAAIAKTVVLQSDDRSPTLALTEEQIKFFHDNGFVGPLTLCTPEEMADYRARVEREVLSTPNKLYGHELSKGRDRHLDSRAVYDLVMNKNVNNCISQLLGEDLLVWRSTFFFKPPGAPETVWHSATVFKEFTEHPILEPEDPEGLFQVTTWIAVDDANAETGPVQLVAGSHLKKISVGRSDEARTKGSADSQGFGADKKGFFGYDIDPKFDIDPSKIHTVLCKPGQYFIFDQRTLHGSPPNTSPNRRLAFNFRSIKTNVPVYRHFLAEQKIEHYGAVWDLSRWGCVLAHGVDRYHLNQVAKAPD